ncbi:MAG: phage tail family protein [Eubacterium sp.]|nr:phage tail family protein [Eubacterium sp.]
MFSLRIRNEYNREIDLTSSSCYTVEEIDGLSPIDARINENEVFGMDGTKFNSAKAEPRVLTIVLAINGPAEDNRLMLYNYLKIKQRHRIFFSNGQKDVYIDGYLQSMPISYFDIQEKAVIVFRCPDPYWKDMIDIGLDIGNTIELFEFPFEIEEPIPFSEIDIYGNKTIFNHGHVASGMIASIRAELTCSNVKIVNVSTGEYIGITGNLSPGEELIIDTIDKEKSISIRNALGVVSNAIGRMMTGSTFLKILPGENVIQLLCTNAEGNAQFLNGVLYINTLYEGV